VTFRQRLLPISNWKLSAGSHYSYRLSTTSRYNCSNSKQRVFSSKKATVVVETSPILGKYFSCFSINR